MTAVVMARYRLMTVLSSLRQGGYIFVQAGLLFGTSGRLERALVIQVHLCMLRDVLAWIALSTL